MHRPRPHRGDCELAPQSPALLVALAAAAALAIYQPWHQSPRADAPRLHHTSGARGAQARTVPPGRRMPSPPACRDREAARARPIRGRRRRPRRRAIRPRRRRRAPVSAATQPTRARRTARTASIRSRPASPPASAFRTRPATALPPRRVAQASSCPMHARTKARRLPDASTTGSWRGVLRARLWPSPLRREPAGRRQFRLHGSPIPRPGCRRSGQARPATRHRAPTREPAPTKARSAPAISGTVTSSPARSTISEPDFPRGPVGFRFIRRKPSKRAAPQRGARGTPWHPECYETNE